MRSMLILEECGIHRHQEKEKQNDDVVSGNGGPEADSGAFYSHSSPRAAATSIQGYSEAPQLP